MKMQIDKGKHRYNTSGCVCVCVSHSNRLCAAWAKHPASPCGGPQWQWGVSERFHCRIRVFFLLIFMAFSFSLQQIFVEIRIQLYFIARLNHFSFIWTLQVKQTKTWCDLILDVVKFAACDTQTIIPVRGYGTKSQNAVLWVFKWWQAWITFFLSHKSFAKLTFGKHLEWSSSIYIHIYKQALLCMMVHILVNYRHLKITEIVWQHWHESVLLCTYTNQTPVRLHLRDGFIYRNDT